MQLQDNVVHRGEAEVLLHEVLRVDFLAGIGIAYQFPGAHSQLPGHLVHNVIGFRMHGGIVQRIGRPADAQEAGALLEGLVSQAGHLLKLFPALEFPMGAAVIGNGLGERRANSAHIAQQIRAGGIQVHAHAVYAAFYGIVQLLFQEALVHVVLVLPYAQGLGVYLHQLRQRVHEPPADGNRPAHGDVVLRKLFPAHLGGGIHGGAVLAHGEDAHLVGQAHLPHELLRLPAGRTAADGDNLYLVFVHPIGHLDDGVHLLGHRRMGVNDVVRQQVALPVQADHLAARSEARVYGHHPLLPHRRGQQQLSEVLPEHLDALDIGLFLGLPQHLAGNGRVHEALPGIFHGLPHLLVGRIAVGLAIVIVKLVGALLPVRVYLHLHEAFVRRAEHGQQVVGRDFGDGLREGEIAAVLGGVRAVLPGLGHLGAHPSRTVDAAEGFTVMGVLADTLRQDVPRALQGFLHRGHLSLHEGGGIGLGIAGLVVPKKVCQRLQSFGHGHRGARFPFGPIRQVQILQLAGADAFLDGVLEFRRQFPLLLDGAQDGSFSLVHLLEDIGPMLYLRHFHVREAARAFLAVTADKGDGATLCKELRTVFHLPGLNIQQSGYVFYI